MQQSADRYAVAAYSVLSEPLSRSFEILPVGRQQGKVTMRYGSLWIGLAAAVLLCSCALREDVYSLDHRLAALERHNVELVRQNRELGQRNEELAQAKEKIASRVEGLDETRRNDEMELRGQYAEMAAQLQAMRDSTQLLSGRLDEMEYLLNQKLKGFETTQKQNQERMDRLATDMAALQKRLDSLGRSTPQGSGQPRQPPPAQASAAAPAAAAGSSLTDQELYQSSKKAFDSGNMDAARKGFETLLADFPKSQLADNAQYFIGETYYREKWYEKAILEYQKVIENYPAGNKVASALLKQAFSFLKIGETNNARLILKDLIARYPGTEEAGIAKKKLESL